MRAPTLSRVLPVLSLATLLFAASASAGEPRSAEARAVQELLSLDHASRVARVATWRAQAVERRDAAEAAVWSAESREQRTCREERRDQARRFVDLVDAVGPQLVRPGTTVERRETAARVLVRTWLPIDAVPPDAPCRVEPLPAGESRVQRSGPDDGLADLPEPLDDDPLTLGFDIPGRRVLRP